MKKIISILICCCIFLLVGCTNKPDGMSDTGYKACVKAIEIIDDFLNMDISSEEASEKLEDVENRLPKDCKDDDLSVSIYISSAQWKMLEMKHPSTTEDNLTKEIKEERNNLAELINKSKI